MSQYGYVNAVKPATPTTSGDRTPVHSDPRIDTICVLAADMAKLLVEHSTILNKCVTALNKPTHSYTKYCWTHGGCNHSSSECRKKATGHQDTASWTNRMGGSDRNVKRE